MNVCEGDLEEGEIADSDDQVAPTREDEKPKAASAPPLSLQMPSHFYQRESHMQHRGARPSGFSSEEEEEEGSDNEIENDSSPCKKKPSLYWPKPQQESTGFQNPLLMSKNEEGDGGCKPKKTNNIWGSVLTDQSLSSVVGGVSTEPTIESFRDVETYDYTRSYLDKRRYEDSDKEALMGDTSEPEDPEDGRDLVDIETFGMESKPKKLTLKDRLGKRSNSRAADESSDGDSSDDSDNTNPKSNIKDRLGSENSNSTSRKNQQSIKDRLGCKQSKDKNDRRLARKRSMKKRQESQSQQIKERLGIRSYDPTIDRSHIRADFMDPVEVVAEEIIRVLGEPEDKLALFTELIDLLGTQRALELLYITEDLETAGGLMTFDGYRRRTMGGVYLTLVKEDDTSNSKDKIGEVFRNENRQFWKQKKQKRKAKAADSKMMTEEGGGETQMEGTELPLKKDVLHPEPGTEDPKHGDLFADAPDIELDVM